MSGVGVCAAAWVIRPPPKKSPHSSRTTRDLAKVLIGGVCIWRYTLIAISTFLPSWRRAPASARSRKRFAARRAHQAPAGLRCVCGRCEGRRSAPRDSPRRRRDVNLPSTCAQASIPSRGRSDARFVAALMTLVPHPSQLDPSSLVGWRRIVMREMDQPALVVPHVLAVHDDAVTRHHRSPLSDGHVVVDEHRLRRTGKANDETLMGTGWAAVVRENPRDHAVGGDLDGRPFFGVVALDRRVVGCRWRARGAEQQKKHDAETAHPLTVTESDALSPDAVAA